ncbi:MAG: ABC transporter permease [Anaerolineae bacterium]|nr:ABC transporter permease [Anaerolineae bacterium]
MTPRYLGMRLATFVLTILVASTLNFAISRLTPQDPIAALLGRMASRGRTVENGAEILALYRERLGLDDPLPQQYLNYMGNLLRGDLGYSLAFFPIKAEAVILRALPWTIGLLSVATLLAFTVGNLLGALAVWPRVPAGFRWLVYLSMPFSAVPYYLLALILVYLFALNWSVFPLGGAFTPGSVRGFDLATLGDLLHHATLPVLSVVLAVIGFWALSMRGIMATVLGDDYLIYAQARGLRSRRIFSHYAMRNAMLPQVTALAIDFGRLISGQVLVEIIFNYPGVGWVLYNALRAADFFVIQGVTLFMVFAVALATLILDLIYPLLDPRIRY